MVYWDWRTVFTQPKARYISANNWRELLRISTSKGYKVSYYSIVQWRPLNPHNYYFEEWPTLDPVTPPSITLNKYRKAFGYYANYHAHLGLYEVRSGHGGLIRYSLDHGFWEYTGYSTRDYRAFSYDLSSFTPDGNMGFRKAPKLTEGMTDNEKLGIFR